MPEIIKFISKEGGDNDLIDSIVDNTELNLHETIKNELNTLRISISNHEYNEKIHFSENEQKKLKETISKITSQIEEDEKDLQYITSLVVQAVKDAYESEISESKQREKERAETPTEVFKKLTQLNDEKKLKVTESYTGNSPYILIFQPQLHKSQTAETAEFDKIVASQENIYKNSKALIESGVCSVFLIEGLLEKYGNVIYPENILEKDITSAHYYNHGGIVTLEGTQGDNMMLFGGELEELKIKANHTLAFIKHILNVLNILSKKDDNNLNNISFRILFLEKGNEGFNDLTNEEYESMKALTEEILGKNQITRDELKAMNQEMLENIANRLDGLRIQNVLNARNKACLDIARDRYEDLGTNTISIIYGAAHMSDKFNSGNSDSFQKICKERSISYVVIE